MAVPAVAPMIHGARRRIEYEGTSNSQNLGTKTVKYVENYTCYMRPNAGMLVHVRTNMLKAAYEKAFEVHHIWLATPVESGKTRLRVSCGGMKKSFLLYNRLLDDRLQGQRRLNRQAIPMEGVDSSVDASWTYISIAKWIFDRCVRAIYSAIAILPLSVYIVGAALVLVVPSKGLLKGMDSSCVHGLPS
ncbi:g5826 [Coccomyxa elongata]